MQATWCGMEPAAEPGTHRDDEPRRRAGLLPGPAPPSGNGFKPIPAGGAVTNELVDRLREEIRGLTREGAARRQRPHARSSERRSLTMDVHRQAS